MKQLLQSFAVFSCFLFSGCSDEQLQESESETGPVNFRRWSGRCYGGECVCVFDATSVDVKGCIAFLNANCHGGRVSCVPGPPPGCGCVQGPTG